MSAEKNQMKQEIQAAAAAHKQEFEKVSAYIFANPELAFTEVKGQQALCEPLENNGFAVTRGVGGISTSFEAVYDTGKPGKNIDLSWQNNDALPEIGHGCGSQHYRLPALPVQA